jgi:nucleoside phosphorylase
VGADHRADIVFLTALSVEFDAVHAHLIGPTPHTDRNGTRYTIGRLPGGRRVALALIGEGNLAAAALVGRAIEEFSPCVLLLVGVAGAITDDAQVGDVVVATRIHTYHGGREESETFRPRPKGWPVAHDLEQAARALAHAGTLPDMRVHFKPIVSGDVILDSRTSPLAGLLATYYSDAIAIDMESAGVAEAAHRRNFHRAMTIRAISDTADGAKRQRDAAGWQPRAAARAAAFAVALAQRVDLPAPATFRGSRPRLRLSSRTAQVLSALLVIATSSLIYLGIWSTMHDRAGSGDRADPGSWATVRTGTDVTLDDWRMIDFETGRMAGFDLQIENNLPSMDLGISHEASRVYGPLAVLDTRGGHDVTRCLAAAVYVDSIRENVYDILTRGRDVCVRTKEGGLAMLTIDQAPAAAFARLTFHYTVWKVR